MDIAAWLRDLGLERYEQTFQQGEIDPGVLPELTDADLRELGIPLGPRKKLLKAIAATRHQSADAAPADIQETAKASAIAAGERRQVTILFADLSGYTRLSGELDAEDMHALLGRFFERADSLVEEYGGTVDKHIGDCVMAVFGAPVAHDNDPERAAYAALAIRNVMPTLSREVGRIIGVHMGLAAGQVVASGTGSASHQQYTVTGESVNLASRLTDRASDAQILISDQARQLLPERFKLRQLGALDLEGIAEPVMAWDLVGLEEAVTARPGPFVGRQAELGQFKRVLRATAETRIGQVIHVRGEAGIGKTRLLEEFQGLAGPAGFASHKVLVLDFGTGTSRDAVRSLVRSLLDLGPSRDATAASAAGTRALEEGLIAEDHQVFLNDLLDLPQPSPLDELYGAMDHSARYRGKRETLAELASSASRCQPLLLVVEDLHWADRVTMEYLVDLARAVAGCPVLLVTTSRIEGDPLEEDWRADLGDTPLMTLDLRPLRDSEAEALAGTYPGAGSDFARRCVERAAGNPLFLEQLLRHAEESVEGVVPGSVQSLVQARMDQLDPGDRQALQAASVFGQRFGLDALRHLLASPGYTPTGLIERQLVQPIGDDLLFGHALIRDAVYDTLLRVSRHELHRKAAAWFGEGEPVLRAEHLDRAGDPTAPMAYLTAARSEGAAYRYERARQLAERGLELAGGPAETFALTCHLGELLHDLGAMPESRSTFQRALEVAEDDDQRCRAWLGLAGVERVTDNVEGAFADLERAEAAARRGDLREQLARVHFLRGNLFFPRGDMEGCLTEHQASLELARDIGSVELEVQALGGLGDAEYVRGRIRTAEARFRECIVLCRAHGFGRTEVASLPMAAVARYYANDIRGASNEATAAVEAAVSIGHQRAEILARHVLALCLIDLGDLSEAEVHAERTQALTVSLGARRFEAESLYVLGETRWQAGKRAEGLALLRRALAMSRETGMAYLGPWQLGALARMSEDHAERRAALAEAEALLAEGSVSHNHLWFYRQAIDTALNSADYDAADRYADALETYTRPEPLPWSDFVVARGRLLTAYGRGTRDDRLTKEMERLAEEARRMGLRTTLAALEVACLASRS